MSMIDFYRGIYWLKTVEGSMYADVYVTPENIDIELNVSKILKECAGVENCYSCQEAVNRREVTGYVKIHCDIGAKELSVSIYTDYNTQSPKLLLKENIFQLN